jgi:gas vesicle protein
MKAELTNKGKSILIPFLVGGAVGAGVTLLLTPKSGKEVREDIKRFAHDSKERVALAIDKGKELYNDSRERVALAIDKGKELYNDSRERVTSAIDKGKEFYDEGRAMVGKAMEVGKTAYVQGKEKWQHT